MDVDPRLKEFEYQLSVMRKYFINKYTRIQLDEQKKKRRIPETGSYSSSNVLDPTINETKQQCIDLRRKIEDLERLMANMSQEEKKKKKKTFSPITMAVNMLIRMKNSWKDQDSSILILGGSQDGQTFNGLCLYNSKENKWAECKIKLPFELTRLGSAILNEKIYIFGGDGGNQADSLESCFSLGEDGEWKKMADMNEKRTNISKSSVTLGSEIWVIGGSNGKEALKTVEKYDPEKDAWSQIPDLNFERDDSAASIINGKIYISGGWSGKRRLKSVEVFDPAKNKWEIFCDMPSEVEKHCSLVDGTDLFIVGGWKADGKPSNEIWKIDILDPNKEWIKMPNFKQKRCLHGALKLSSGIMLFGGSINPKERLDSVEIFDEITWEEGPKLPQISGSFSFISLPHKTEKQLLQFLC